MAEKSFGFSKGIIAVLTSNINDDIAEQRPVTGSVVMAKGVLST